MTRILSILFLLWLIFSAVSVHAVDPEGIEEEPDFVSCRSCKIVQSFSIEFGLYFGVILYIHISRWFRAGEDTSRKTVTRGYIIQTLTIIGVVFLILYVASWVAGFFGFIVLDPHTTMQGCDVVCIV